jgi:hypothetical protein
MGIVLAPGVSKRPDSSTENIVQPVVDAVDLTLRPFSNAQTSPILRIQNVDGSVDWFDFKPDGSLSVNGSVGAAGEVLTSGGPGVPASFAAGGGSLSGAVILAPSTSTRNLIQATADAVDLTLRPFSDTQTNPVFQVQNAAGSTTNAIITRQGFIRLGPTPIEHVTDSWITGMGTGTYALSIQGSATGSALAVTAGSANQACFIGFDQNDNGIFYMNGTGTGNAISFSSGIATDSILTLTPFSGQTASQMIWTDPSFAPQMQVAANGRDWILDTTTGTQWGTSPTQKQGWYGATPVVQQANASAAGIASIAGSVYATDSAAIKAALTAIRSALAANGLLANTA